MRVLWPLPALALCVVLPWVPGVPVFWVTLLNYIGISAIVVIGLVVLTGIGGMTSFGQASFVGFGAYTTAILSTQYAVSPWLALAAAIAVSAVAALLIGAITLRLSGHYLALGTLAWGVSLYYTFANLDFFGRNDGISRIPPLDVFGTKLIDGRLYFTVIWVGVVLACLATGNLLDSRAGRAIRALRGGALAAASFGVDTLRARMLAFVYAAMLAAFAGWLYAHMQRSVNPTPFGLNASIEYLFMAVVGGAAHVPGALLGAGLVTIVNDRLQDILPKLFGAQGSFETIVFGAILVAVLQAAPEGVWPHLARIRLQRHRVRPDAPPLPVRAPAPRGTPILEVAGLHKTFGGLTAVNNIAFSVAAGEIVGLIGPNGAGKSTTFNLLTGVTAPSAGSVRFAGQPLIGLPARTIARLGIARTFQHVKLVASMSVIENVAIGAHLRGHASALDGLLRLDRAEEARLFAEAARQLARVGLADAADRPATSLALGQQRIVEIARALCLDPVLLLLDEPAAGLRHNEKAELATLLRRLREEGVAILLVEHDMDFVMNLTDRLVVMDFGTKLAEGPAETVRNDPAVIEAYLGSVA
ncbi:branched-chain amino acid ABC transporter ATP-binding protein/permease [Limobrevibacterium gyesilva]|uniref:Branched-chain amino acid ABC transporter ATP-binding protein/permease n=1 Tax=Limobrevibacterium gyesilva TaxID=2991712 RepID=A0AA42CH09_9PROT|nr:branched-chain amino acid ABC transporter ATP-binding protein/permease [Limobrevibacterium gyesilva]MCW3474497.1 branched-chain amino acid ABC transporter ATP-binding protein/permease [Limobrevibacterium gyesilva]